MGRIATHGLSARRLGSGSFASRMSKRFSGKTTSAAVAGRIIEIAMKARLPIAPFLATVGLPVEALRDPERQVPAEVIDALWEQVYEGTGDRGAALRTVYERRLEDFHVMGFAIMTSRTGREALERAARFTRLLTNGARWRLSERDDVGVISVERPGARTLGAAMSVECGMAEFLHSFRQSSNDDFVPCSVSFKHAAPTDTSAHRSFFRTRIAFGSDQDEFTFPKSLLDVRPKDANAALSAFFLDHAESLLAKLGRATDDLSTRIRRAIARDLASGSPQMTAIAREHGMSERSLRRSLADEGTSFRQVVEEVRLERAEELLSRGDLNVGEVAFLVGFSDLSAFSRAFKRARGTAPGSFEAVSERR